MAGIGLAAIALDLGLTAGKRVAATLHPRVGRQDADAVLAVDAALQIGQAAVVGNDHGDIVHVAFPGAERQVGDAG